LRQKKIFKKKKSHQRVGVRGDCKEAFLVKGSVAFSCADLGGSSKYSSEKLEDRSGERFHENSI